MVEFRNVPSGLVSALPTPVAKEIMLVTVEFEGEVAGTLPSRYKDINAPLAYLVKAIVVSFDQEHHLMVWYLLIHKKIAKKQMAHKKRQPEIKETDNHCYSHRRW